MPRKAKDKVGRRPASSSSTPESSSSSSSPAQGTPSSGSTPKQTSPNPKRKSPVPEETGAVAPGPEPATPLPPCRICGDVASGFHYGANTCEACKGFYRRCLRRGKDIFVCSENKNCPLNPETKGLCGYCRYQKCIEVGMSKNAIKTGRYTLERKSDYIKEVNSLKHQSKPSKNNSQSTNKSQTQVNKQINNENLSTHQTARNVPMENVDDAVKNGKKVENNNKNPSKIDTAKSQSGVKRPAEEGKQPEEEMEVDREEILEPDPKRSRLSARDDREKISLINTMRDVFRRTTPYSEELIAHVAEKHTQYLENKAVMEDLFGPMRPLSRNEYYSILKETGLDIDGRMEWAHNTLFPLIDQSIRKYTEFSKNVPGFTSLPSDDRIALVKASTFEWWLLTSFKGVDTELGLITNHLGETLTKSDMMKFGHRKNLMDDYIRLCSSLQRISPDDEEVALMMGLILLSRDRCELSEPDKAEECQEALLASLQYHVTRTRGLDGRHFAKLMSIITETRTPSHFHVKSKSRFVNRHKQKNFLDIPPLLQEIWSDS